MVPSGGVCSAAGRPTPRRLFFKIMVTSLAGGGGIDSEGGMEGGGWHRKSNILCEWEEQRMRRRNLQVSSAPHPLVLFSTSIICRRDSRVSYQRRCLRNSSKYKDVLSFACTTLTLYTACRTIRNTWCNNVRANLNTAQFCMTSDETRANGISPYNFPPSLSL